MPSLEKQYESYIDELEPVAEELLTIAKKFERTGLWQYDETFQDFVLTAIQEAERVLKEGRND